MEAVRILAAVLVVAIIVTLCCVSMASGDDDFDSSTVANMTTSEKDSLCQTRMRRGSKRRTMDKLKSSGVDCMGAMKRNPSFKPLKAQASMVVSQMRESGSARSWDQDSWSTVVKQMPTALKASDLRTMNTTILKNLIKNGELQSSKRAFKSKSKKRALQSQVKSTYGNPSTWDNSTLSDMGSLIEQMDRKTIKSIRSSQLRSVASSFKDMEFEDKGKRAAFGAKLVTGLGSDNAGNWSVDDVINADQYIRTNPSIISQLSDSTLSSALSSLGSRRTRKRRAAQFARRLKRMSQYSDATSIDSSTVSKMGHLMTGMGRRYLKKISSDVVNGSLSTLANVSFPRGEARELMGKIKGTPSSYDSDKIKEFGYLIIGLDAADLENISSSAIADSIEDLADKDFDASQCRKIVKKVMSAKKSKLQKVGKLMSKCMSPNDLDSVSVSDLGLNCSDTVPSFTPGRAMAKKMFAKLRAEYGSPANNTNYTLECFLNWGAVAALGMDADDLENLPDNGDLGAVFEILSDNEYNMDESQTWASSKRVRRHLDMDNDTSVASTDSATIEQVGKFMKHFNDSDLAKFNASVRQDIARKIGQANLDNMYMVDLIRMKNFALSSVLRDDTGEVTNRTGASTLDDNDIRDLGNLSRGLELSDINKIDGEAMSLSMDDIGNNVRGKDNMIAVWIRLFTYNANFLNSSDNIISSAGIVGGLDDSQLSQAPASALGNSLADFASSMETRKGRDKSRDRSGFTEEVSDSDKSSMTSSRLAYIRKAFEGYTASQDSSNTGRRRRSTAAITCSDVSVLGSNAVALTSTQLSSMSTTEFTDCTETMGAITTWDAEQLTTLGTLSKAAYGSTPSSWSSNDVKLIATMTAGLTSAEIATLQLSSASVLSTMGTSAAFSAEQLAAGFSQFLSLTHGSSAVAVTGDDLLTIGSFACGATTGQIVSFTSSNYKTAASALGELTSCSSIQLSAYASLAKAAYGATSTWDSTVITTVGTVIGGLTKTELAALTTTQIAFISTTSLAQIPPATFAGFSSAQIASFSTSQANSVTAAQQAALSSDQLSALTGAGATDKVTANTQSSGYTTTACSTIWMFSLAVLLMWSS